MSIYRIISGSKVYQYILVIVWITCSACGSQNDRRESRQTDSAFELGNPNSDIIGIHAVNGWVNTPIPIYIGPGFSGSQELAILSAMKTWSDAVGRDLFDYQGIDKDFYVRKRRQQSAYDARFDGYNGIYLINDWQIFTRKDNQVLGSAIWDYTDNQRTSINRADIFLNLETFTFQNALDESSEIDNNSKNIVDLESLVLHELGHFLGLSHINQPSSIMQPHMYIGHDNIRRVLSAEDKKNINTVY